jgi:hypothetical protein
MLEVEGATFKYNWGVLWCLAWISSWCYVKGSIRKQRSNWFLTDAIMEDSINWALCWSHISHKDMQDTHLCQGLFQPVYLRNRRLLRELHLRCIPSHQRACRDPCGLSPEYSGKTEELRIHLHLPIERQQVDQGYHLENEGGTQDDREASKGWVDREYWRGGYELVARSA